MRQRVRFVVVGVVQASELKELRAWGRGGMLGLPGGGEERRMFQIITLVEPACPWLLWFSQASVSGDQSPQAQCAEQPWAFRQGNVQVTGATLSPVGSRR